jgi:hypothetical protein
MTHDEGRSTMSTTREQLEEIYGRTLREARALPPAAARERRAQGLREARLVIEGQGVPLIATGPDITCLPPPGSAGMRRMHERRR